MSGNDPPHAHLHSTALSAPKCVHCCSPAGVRVPANRRTPLRRQFPVRGVRQELLEPRLAQPPQQDARGRDHVRALRSRVQSRGRPAYAPSRRAQAEHGRDSRDSAHQGEVPPAEHDTADGGDAAAPAAVMRGGCRVRALSCVLARVWRRNFGRFSAFRGRRFSCADGGSFCSTMWDTERKRGGSVARSKFKDSRMRQPRRFTWGSFDSFSALNNPPVGYRWCNILEKCAEISQLQLRSLVPGLSFYCCRFFDVLARSLMVKRSDHHDQLSQLHCSKNESQCFFFFLLLSIYFYFLLLTFY